MKCEICSKNAAKIHITQIKDNLKHSLHICPECAHSKGISGTSVNISFSIEELLTDTTDSPQNSVPALAHTHQTCPTCGLSYGAFKESGRLGCPDCYFTFSSQLKPLLNKVQKDLVYKGKAPSKGDAQYSLRRELSDLRVQLKDAVSAEDFEEAARLRDHIYELENEITQPDRLKKQDHQQE